MVWEAGGVIVMMWWPQGRAGHLTHHPGSEDGQRWIFIKNNGMIMREVKLCPGCYKWVVNAQVFISQQSTQQQVPRQHKLKMFKIIITIFLVLSISMLTQSAPAAEPVPQRDPFCLCPRLFAPVCGSNSRTYGNSCEAGCDSVRVVCGDSCDSRTCN